jgi:hypothetical protein
VPALEPDSLIIKDDAGLGGVANDESGTVTPVVQVSGG